MHPFLLEFDAALSPADIFPVAEMNTRSIPVVTVREINRGSIVGTIGSGARLVLGDTLVTPRADGAFTVEAAPFLRNIVDIQVPPWAQYVGSSQGTKYYPVASKQWLSWKSEPLFFRDRVEAEGAGYERGKE